MHKGRIALGAALVAPLFWAISLGQPAAATSNKPYSVVATSSVGAGQSLGGSETSGGTPIPPLTFTITNDNPLQTLGSADISPATGAGFILFTTATTPSITLNNYSVSPSPTVDISNNTIELRGLSMPFGGSATVSVSVDVPCSNTIPAGSPAWTVVAKQANDFSGNPGNNFNLDSGTDLSTNISGNCSFSFLNQPADTQVNTAVSPVAFTPPGPNAPPIEVQITDSLNNAIDPADQSASASVTMGLAAANPTGLQTVPASSGVASFNDIVVGSPTQSGVPDHLETFVQNPTGYAPSYTPADSGPFVVWAAGSICVQGNTCHPSPVSTGSVSASGSGTASAASTYTSPSELGLDQNAGYTVNCQDSFHHASTDGTPVYTTLETVNLSAAQVKITINNPLGPPSQYEVCFQDTTVLFQVLGSGPTPTLTTGPALLATCKQTSNATPCVGSISKNKQGAVVEVVQLPPTDPCTAW